ncbi:MAG: DegT/DnrJ/EryC1/StrS family aminotransferase, partial [Candidatus Methylomirabilis sp.]|nr:DegT/DnrJ/EryC1/StrS family aminotransferase [Deltaproteobacteria bacterium]
MRIPLVDLAANYRSIQGEVDAAMRGVLESCAFILGPEVKRFEEDFAAYCGARRCVGVGSGTDALELALKVLGIGPGDEVIVPANTFIATCLAVSALGASPVLVDCRAEDHLLDVAKVRERITPRSRAIVPVHLYGRCADMDAVLAIAREHGLKVVEDACQAHGAVYKGRRAGTMGDAGCFSFYPGKNLGAYGDGGAVVTNSDGLADELLYWRNWGSRVKYHHEVKGLNSRLDTLQAAVLGVKLRRLDAWNGLRRRWAGLYGERLAGVGDLKLPETPSDGEHVWHLYVVETDARDALLASLHEQGVGAGIHYPIPIHELGAYKELGLSPGDLPVASRADP